MSITASVDFQVDDAMIADLASGDEIMSAVRDCADVIAAVAQGYCVQHIADTIEILGEDGNQVYVGSASSFAHLWEFGSIKTPTLAFMRRAAEDVAGSFE
jgi:hypothetical protein